MLLEVNRTHSSMHHMITAMMNERTNEPSQAMGDKVVSILICGAKEHAPRAIRWGYAIGTLVQKAFFSRNSVYCLKKAAVI